MSKVVTLSANTSWYLFNFRASTIRRLISEGYHVVCLSPDDDYSGRLQGLGCEWKSLRMENQGSNPIADVRLVLQFFRYYRRLHPVAALHFTIKNNVYGTWAACLTRVPAINNVSGLGTAFIRAGFVSWVVRLLYRLSQPFARVVFCQNPEDYRVLLDNRLVPVDRLALLPGSGVDLKRFNWSPCRSREGPFRFLYAGRMLGDKGLRELIAAMRELHDQGQSVVLWLCGFADAENSSSISEQQLLAWGEETYIEWLGATDTIETILADVDCVVLPSYREGLPRSLLEAGAMGLPVVATDVPGCRHVVQHGVNGLLCRARDIASLQGAMAQMLTMPIAERSRMGLEARRIVESMFSDNLVVDATLKAVRQVEASRGS